MRTSLHFAPALAGIGLLTILAACGETPPTAPNGDGGIAPAKGTVAAGVPIDLSGAWDWYETGHLNLSLEAAALFGVTPEGPRTQIRCESGGTMTIVQSGDTFTGTATQSSLCESNGGQVFVPAPFPPALDIIGGRISGRHVEFLFGAGPIPCPYKASARMEGGSVVALVGSGKCIVPGHPQSPLPVPPPPTAPTKTIEWIATR